MCGGGNVVLRVFGLRHPSIMASGSDDRGEPEARSQEFVLLLTASGGRPTFAGLHREVGSVTHPRAPAAAWRAVRNLPDFWRLLELRAASQFGDGLFQAGLAGALLFNPERASRPLEIAGAFAVLFLPYSLLGPFAGALMDRWDRRLVLIAANVGRVVSVAVVGDLPGIRCPRLARAVRGAGGQRARPVRLVRSVRCAAACGAPRAGRDDELDRIGDRRDRGIPRRQLHARATGDLRLRRPRCGVDHSAGHHSAADLAAAVAAIRRTRAGSRRHPAGDPRVGPLRRRHRLDARRADRAGPSHRGRHAGRDWPHIGWCSASTRCWCCCWCAAATTPRSPRWAARCCSSPPPAPDRFWRTWSRRPRCAAGAGYATANGALAIASLIEITGVGLQLWVLVTCGFLLGGIGQVVKLCADTAIQIDVDDALRGHVFAVQDSLFWVAFIGAITVAAMVIPANGHSPALVVAGAAIYLCGLAAHSRRRAARRESLRYPDGRPAADRRRPARGK